MKLTWLDARPRLRAILCIIALAGSTVLSTLLNGALTVALPSMAKDVGLSVEEAQWPLTSLSLVNGALLLVFGSLADAFGRRASFLIGVAWLMVVSLLTVFVRDGKLLIVASAAMGVGNALIAPASVGILGASIPAGSLKNTAFACLGAGQAIGYIVGLLLGGVFAKRWHAIYYFMLAFAGLFLGLAFAVVPQDGVLLVANGQGQPAGSQTEAASYTRDWRRSLAEFDYLGAILATSGLVLLTFGLADAELAPHAWATPYIPSLLSVSVVILCSFILWERRMERNLVQFEASGAAGKRPTSPLLPPSVLTAPRLGPMLLFIFGAWMSFNCLSFFSTLFLQEIQGTPPLKTSISFLPLVVAGLVLNICAGWLVSRISTFLLLIVGGLMVLAASVVFAVMDPAWGYWRGVFWVMVLQVGPDVAFPSAQLLAVQSVGPHQASIAGSLFNTVTRLATSFGLAITSSISTGVARRAAATMGEKEALLQGYRAAGWACFAAAAYSLAIAVVWLRDVGIVGARDPPRVVDDKKREEEAVIASGSQTQRALADAAASIAGRSGTTTAQTTRAPSPAPSAGAEVIPLDDFVPRTPPAAMTPQRPRSPQ